MTDRGYAGVRVLCYLVNLWDDIGQTIGDQHGMHTRGVLGY
jgi:hypothetical protein